MKELKAECLCGAVEYSVEDRLDDAGYCHCSECRSNSGSAFSAFGGIAEDALGIVKGAEHMSTYQKTEDSLLCFCSICGSSLFSRKPKMGMVHLRLGSLTDVPGLKPQAHVFVNSKSMWYEITDNLPQLEEMANNSDKT